MPWEAGRLRFEPDLAPLRVPVAGVNQQYLPSAARARTARAQGRGGRFLPNVAELLQHRWSNRGSIEDGGSRKGSKGNAVRVREHTMPRLPPQL
jgi:hypothetical protein